jgi:hypothetical protein
MLEKFRAAHQDAAFEQQRIKRIAINEARATRAAEREAAKKARDNELAARVAEFAAQARHDVEKAEALAKVESTERDAALATEQKAERDARYAARKAAKKIRRRGY